MIFLGQPTSGSNLKIMLFSRFVKFVNAINKSNKPALRFLLALSKSDVRTLTGANLRSILLNTGIEVQPGITSPYLVKKHVLSKVPDEDRWKIPLLHSLLAVRAEEFEIIFDDDDNIDEDMNIGVDILENICCG